MTPIVQWEYKIDIRTDVEGGGYLDLKDREYVQIMGEYGWELVQLLPVVRGFQYFFKRPKQQ